MSRVSSVKCREREQFIHSLQSCLQKQNASSICEFHFLSPMSAVACCACHEVWMRHLDTTTPLPTPQAEEMVQSWICFSAQPTNQEAWLTAEEVCTWSSHSLRTAKADRLQPSAAHTWETVHVSSLLTHTCNGSLADRAKWDTGNAQERPWPWCAISTVQEKALFLQVFSHPTWVT